ncbi:MAG: LysR family transcriptional regulator, low CO2-responsive transcriptional regulator [Thermoleophilaceae bacterium]|nr:LysR family transcriptional regulator, low CO2-responsive transcriptional regulator [Thermoleophilaceae bacterium]
MTFAQLRSFATVARLGSVRAAAAELAVSEPAVSSAIAVLRKDFADDLLVRSGGSLQLTPGGQRLAAAASEILGLADEARRSVGAARGEARVLRVAATSDVAEYALPTLVEAFTRRIRHTEVSVLVEPADAFPALLANRMADVALGPRPDAEPALGIQSSPFLRYRLVVVAGSRHPLARRRALPPAALAGERWLVGPSGTGAGTAVGGFFASHRLEPDEVRAFPTHSAAVMGAEAGRGVTLAVAHTVMDELRRGTLVRLDVRSTPLDELWHATTLGPERRPELADALRRFITTPEATHALLARSSDVPAGRFRPPVYTTLWHS